MALGGQDDKLCTVDAEELRRKENVKYLLRKDVKDAMLLADGGGGGCGLLPPEAKVSELSCI